MRYWHPFTGEAIQELRQHAPADVVLLPLYPQYSKTTTGSSLNEWDRHFHNGHATIHRILDYHDDPDFIASMVEAVNGALKELPGPFEDLDFVFSAHSLPVAVVEAGDPYQKQIERTRDLVWAKGRWPGRAHLCYQSKVGTAKWLAPSMDETIRRLAAEGRRRVLVVPISFVSDHVE